MAEFSVDVYHILTGLSRSGFGRSAVCLGRRTVHAPAPYRPGSVGPLNGLYHVEIVAIDPANSGAPAPKREADRRKESSDPAAVQP